MHRGQVGQPSPEAVTRTPAPVTVMPALATTEASAQARIDRGVGAQNEANPRTKRLGWSVESFTSSMVRAVAGGPGTGKGASQPQEYVTYYCRKRCPHPWRNP
ncbi:hypothetical protein GCM10009734_74520 [Nonomuraea bangladeshensis]